MKTEKRLVRNCWPFGAALSLLIAVTLLACQSYPAATGAARQKSPQASPSPAEPKQIRIDLDKAVSVALPEMRADLKAVSFKTADGKEGWALRIPGARPIATPAYADGLIFVGGGYGSHEFYAFDAATGALAWKMRTSDDGPTAAVVEDGYVAFNTESCTLIVVEAKTGKVVWQEWLGDPLMSQPAISKGRVFIAYPAGQRGHQQSLQNIKPHSAASQVQQSAAAQNQSNAAKSRRTGHRLLCADLKTGKHIWEQEITGDVISAPVVSEDQIFFTCFDGTSFCLNAQDGSVVWKKENAGTSAPLVAAGHVIITQKETVGAMAYEGLKRVDVQRGDERDQKLLAREKAEYLGENKGGGVALKQEAQAALDSSVGFASAPAAASLGAANKHVGVNTVAGGWAYQGSRAAYSRGNVMNAQGNFLNSINASNGLMNWRAEVQGGGTEANAQIFSPPALGDEFMYLSSSLGHLVSVRQKDGALGFAYLLKQPMVFQPALAKGNLYVGTANGLLICLKTGDKDADGWYAWGGNAQHNKNK